METLKQSWPEHEPLELNAIEALRIVELNRLETGQRDQRNDRKIQNTSSLPRGAQGRNIIAARARLGQRAGVEHNTEDDLPRTKFVVVHSRANLEEGGE